MRGTADCDEGQRIRLELDKWSNVFIANQVIRCAGISGSLTMSLHVYGMSAWPKMVLCGVGFYGKCKKSFEGMVCAMLICLLRRNVRQQQ